MLVAVVVAVAVAVTVLAAVAVAVVVAVAVAVAVVVVVVPRLVARSSVFVGEHDPRGTLGRDESFIKKQLRPN